MFKERLKKLRTDRGLTQEQLADKLEVPHSTIRRYESMDEGYPKEERLQVIADFFSCTVDYLLGRESIEKTYNAELDKDKQYLLDLIVGIEDPIKRKAAITVLEGLAGKK